MKRALPNGDGPRRMSSRGLARLRRALDLFPWTPLGVLLALGAFGAVRLLALQELDLVWLVVGYVGLGLALVSPLFVVLAAVWLKWRRSGSHDGETLLLETRKWAETGYRLPSLVYFPLLQVRWSWIEPGGVELALERRGAALSERARPGERGRFERIERRVVVSDVFGLSRIAIRLRETRSLAVLPALGALRDLPALHAFASGDAVPHPMGLEDGDRFELRRYSPGDPARFIHWKVLARARKLMVRTPERALSVARRMAAFVVAGPRDDASAAVARLALERRLLGTEWSFGTDEQLAGVSSIPEALEALMRSSALHARAGQGLAAFAESSERKGPVSLVVFAPSRPGAWLERVAAVARRRKLRVVIGVDGVYERERPSFLRRMLAFQRAPTGTKLAELNEVLRALGTASVQVTVIDRGSGRVLGSADRQARPLPTGERKRRAVNA